MTAKELVLQTFPGRGFVSAVEAGTFIGLAAQTTYNLIHLQEFPLPIHRAGRSLRVSVLDLIRYMERQPNTELKMEPNAPRRRGRPTRAETAARAAASQGR
jgi:predicted DNA-binding transcriptional regulator AlpA